MLQRIACTIVQDMTVSPVEIFENQCPGGIIQGISEEIS